MERRLRLCASGHFCTQTCKVGPFLALAIPTQNKKLVPLQCFHGTCIFHQSNLVFSLSSLFSSFVALLVLVNWGVNSLCVCGFGQSPV